MFALKIGLVFHIDDAICLWLHEVYAVFDLLRSLLSDRREVCGTNPSCLCLCQGLEQLFTLFSTAMMQSDDGNGRYPFSRVLNLIIRTSLIPGVLTRIFQRFGIFEAGRLLKQSPIHALYVWSCHFRSH